MNVQRRKRLALLAGVGVALVAYMLILRRRPAAPVGPVQSFDQLPADVQPGGGGATTDPAVADLGDALSAFVKVTEDRQTALESQQLQLVGALDDLAASFSSGGGGGGWFTPQIRETEGGTVVIGPDGQVTVIPRGVTTAGPAGQTPTVNAKRVGAIKETGVWWGGTLYGAGLGSEFIKDQLRPKGINPQVWARQHPRAARYLGIPLTAQKRTTAAPISGRGKPSVAPTSKTRSLASVVQSYRAGPPDARVTGAPGSPTIGGGTVGQLAPNVSLGGGSGTSSKKPLLMPEG